MLILKSRQSQILNNDANEMVMYRNLDERCYCCVYGTNGNHSGRNVSNHFSNGYGNGH